MSSQRKNQTSSAANRRAKSAPGGASAARRPAQRSAQPGRAPLYDQRADWTAAERREAQAQAQARTGRRRKGANPARRVTKSEMRRRRRNRRIAAVLLVLALVAAGVAVSVAFLFKVSTLRVEAMDRTLPADTGAYTEAEILASLNIAEGDNMFSFRVSAVEEQLRERFPLLEEVKVLRSYPSTVIVRLEPAKPTYCIQAEGGWLVLSSRLKIIRVADAAPENLLLLAGTVPANPVVGESLRLKMETLTTEEGETEVDPLETLETLAETLVKYELFDGVTKIELQDTSNLAVWYQNRIQIDIGTLNQLDYKLQMAATLLHNRDGRGISETDTGVLHVSHIKSDGKVETRLTPFTEAEWAALNGQGADPAPEDAGEPGADGSDGDGGGDNGADPAGQAPGGE